MVQISPIIKWSVIQAIGIGEKHYFYIIESTFLELSVNVGA